MVNPLDIKVMFMPAGDMALVPKGISVMEAAHRLGLQISEPCGGRGTCGKCRIKLLTGEFLESGISSNITALTPFTAEERRFLSKAERVSGVRLACQANLMHDAVFEILSTNDYGEDVISKKITEVEVKTKPVVKLYHMQNCVIDKEDPPFSLLSMVQDELSARFGFPQLYFDTPALAKLPLCVQKGDFYALIWNDGEVLDLRLDQTILGAALDLGTTTIALYLCDLATGRLLASCAAPNPQAVRGADVISRMVYQYGSSEKLWELQDEVVSTVNGLLSRALAQAGHTADQVVDLAAVGNPVMMHLFMGVPPNSIGVRPFITAVGEVMDLKARDLGIYEVNPAAYVHCPPALTGYVGADVAADMIALEERMAEFDTCLLMDIGTSGEIVLKNNDEYYAAACNTGPAFEGGNISCGVPPVAGAIEHVLINPQTLAVRVKLMGSKGWMRPGDDKSQNVAGICGPGLIDAVSQMNKTYLIEPGGRFSQQNLTHRLVDSDGERRFVLFFADENAEGREISLTQADVHSVQKAKGALYGGCTTLLQKAGLEKVDKVLLTGAYEANIDALSAFDLALFPAKEPTDVEFTGHSTGYGAILLLLSIDRRRAALELSQKTQYVELSEEDDFNAPFLAVAFPANASSETQNYEDKGKTDQDNFTF